MQGIENLFCSLCLFFLSLSVCFSLTHSLSSYVSLSSLYLCLSLCLLLSLSLILAPSPCLSFSKSSLSYRKSFKNFISSSLIFLKTVAFEIFLFLPSTICHQSSKYPCHFLCCTFLYRFNMKKKSILSSAFISFKLVTLINIL